VSARTAQVVYHVGAHKTGTSLVQSYLAQNRRPLRKQKVTYLTRPTLENWVRGLDGHSDDPGALKRKLGEAFQRRPEGIVIASFENTLGPPFSSKRPGLYPRAQERAEALREVLSEYSAKVLLGIRPQSGFVESYYIQLVQQGGYQTFADWFGELDLEQLSWRPVVDTLVSTFGRDAVEVIDFTTIRNGALAYLRGFLDRVDPDLWLEEAEAPRDNASLSDKGLRIALAANPHLTSKDERVAMRKFLQEEFPNTRYPRPVLLSEAERAKLDARYTADYEELVREYG
jgi:hypothetical protein